MSFATTFVVNTFNKLPYLRETMPRLLENVQPDDEVVVVEGGSVDGTTEYLRGLEADGRIHQLISEPDKGEAHAWNKGLLAARGELIKVITDDDVFCYASIRKCTRFMLDHSEIDVVGTDGTDSAWNQANQRASYEPWVKQYLSERRPFGFCGLGLILRRRSLCLTGLFDAAWKCIDHEFTLRLTRGPSRFAWFSGRTWVRITNPTSNTVKYNTRVWEESRRLDSFYGTSQPFFANCSAVVRRLRSKLTIAQPRRKPDECAYAFPEDFRRAYDWCEEWLRETNRKQPGRWMVRQDA